LPPVRKGDNVLVDLHRRALLPSLDYATPCSAIRMGIAPRVHSFGHGHRQVRADRRGAPSILCRDDTREGTSLPDSTAEVLSNPAASFRQWPRHRSALALFAGRRNDAVYPDGRIDGTLASDDPGLQAPVSIDIGAQLCGMELNASRPRSCPASTQKPRFKVAHPLVALQGKNLRDGRNASLNPGNAALRASPVCNER